MSKVRHKKRGGGVSKESGDSNPPVTEAYAGGDSNVAKEAKERKRGGKVEGKAAKHRLHRKSGGRVGSNNRPLSSAASVKEAPASMGRD